MPLEASFFCDPGVANSHEGHFISSAACSGLRGALILQYVCVIFHDSGQLTECFLLVCKHCTSQCAPSWGATAPGAVGETQAHIGGIWVRGEHGRSARESLGGLGKPVGTRVVEFTKCLFEGGCGDLISNFLRPTAVPRPDLTMPGFQEGWSKNTNKNR